MLITLKEFMYGMNLGDIQNEVLEGIKDSNQKPIYLTLLQEVIPVQYLNVIEDFE
jgi:hypothetical protein